MTKLRPFFTYFGAKWRAAPKYPPPIYDTIIEPFAGSAGYSLRYADRKVILVEKSEPIAGIWRYLIGASERDILSLPPLEPGQSVDTLGVCQEARWLIGMWVQTGRPSPRSNKPLARPGVRGVTQECWGPLAMRRIAAQLGSIRHWKIRAGDYSTAPSAVATWFIDPPYEKQGVAYPCGATDIAFGALAHWCRERRGQVLVCEQRGANWLPFVSYGAFASNKSHGLKQRSAESLWMNEWPGAALWLPAKESA